MAPPVAFLRRRLASLALATKTLSAGAPAAPLVARRVFPPAAPWPLPLGDTPPSPSSMAWRRPLMVEDDGSDDDDEDEEEEEEQGNEEEEEEEPESEVDEGPEPPRRGFIWDAPSDDEPYDTDSDEEGEDDDGGEDEGDGAVTTDDEEPNDSDSDSDEKPKDSD